MTDRYLAIDEEGYFVFDGRRVDDEKLGALLLNNIRAVDTNRWVTSMEGQDAWVEGFNAPFVARGVRLAAAGAGAGASAAVPPADEVFGEIDLPYHCKAVFPFSTLSLDEWDRFHGWTTKGIPFVLSRQAQMEFFDLLDSFDDDSVTVNGKTFATPAWLSEFPDSNNSKFWDGIYEGPKVPWELGTNTPVLTHVLPQLKLSKSRVLVLGCGSGHDAAYLARQGHTVTAVDFSDDAIARARENYGSVEGLKIVQADAFNLPAEWTGKFDLIFEHTFYCAISPDRRNEVVKTWRRMLHDQGHLLAVFFVMEKRGGPAFGGSEWEVRERLSPCFEALFWTRWHASVDDRKSKELVVYARKLK